MSADGLLVWCDPEPEPIPTRVRLPNRRECFTETILVGNGIYDASIGFDEAGNPKEIFLSGAKSGTDMAAVLSDTGILISIALQRGVPAQRMAPSMSRLPDGWTDDGLEPASVLGAALDLLARYEGKEWR